MQIDITQLVAYFLPPQLQAYFFILIFLLYVVFNAVAPFLKKYKFNGLEHMIYLAFTELKIDPATKTITINSPSPDQTGIKQEVTPNVQVSNQPDPSLTC